jgi:uncharacterized OB-fold protein
MIVPQSYAFDGRPLPRITPVAEPFFAAARRGDLLLQRCPRDGFFFYPRLRCPGCLGDDWTWTGASPWRTVHAFTIDHRGQDPHLRPFAPLLLAVVDLDDGPRMVGQVLGCRPDEIAVGRRVRVEFEVVEDAPLIRFKPADALSGPGRGLGPDS